jgi:hypothetical protein
MISITTHRDLQAVQKLPFCYLCGKPFRDDEKQHRDHVPPKTCFAVRDRKPLILSTHYNCNSERSITDKQIGQIIGMKHGKVPTERDRALDLKFSGPLTGAVVNVNIPDEVWRWVKGFHAALYREPYPKDARGALVTPFPSAPLRDDGRVMFDPIKPQHQVFVETIKINRANRCLDTIRCNRGKLVYECVWCPSDDGSIWLCIFAIDIYGWKDLGNPIVQPARGCAGFYTLPDGHAPPNATTSVIGAIIMPNFDKLDPFSR